MAIVPGPLSLEDVRNFHPHFDEIADREKVKQLLQFVAGGSMKINCWTDGGRNAVTFTFSKQLIIVIWGNDNPTMFPANNIDRVRTITGGMSPVTSSNQINEMRRQIGVMGNNL